MRLISRAGGDYTKLVDRRPARMNPPGRFIIDGEAVLLGDDGVSDFDGLHSGKHDEQVQLYAFDILAMGSNDLKELPLSMRKQYQARLIGSRSDGIFFALFELSELGPDLFRKACEFGLEGVEARRARL